MSLGKVVELHSQAKQSLVWNKATVVCFYEWGTSKLICPRTARVYVFRLLRLSVGS